MRSNSYSAAMLLFNSLLIFAEFATAMESSPMTTVPTPNGLTSTFNDTIDDCPPCPRCPGSVAPPPMTSQDSPFDHPYVRNMRVHGMLCLCNVGVRTAPLRDDYHYTPDVGSHKLHTRAASWNAARKVCIEEGGHLAVVNSVAEAQVLRGIFNRTGPIKGGAYHFLALVGIHDLYEEGDWVTVLGDSLAKSGFAVWSDKWGGQPDNGGGQQNCGGFMKDGTLDDVACNVPFPFFCELPIMHAV